MRYKYTFYTIFQICQENYLAGCLTIDIKYKKSPP